MPPAARLCSPAHCSKPPLTSIPIAEKDFSWQHTLTNPTISEIISPTGPTAREGMLPDLVTTDAQLLLRVVGAGIQYVDQPEPPAADSSRTYRLVHTSDGVTDVPLGDLSGVNDLRGLYKTRFGMDVHAALVPKDGFFGVGANGELGQATLGVDRMVYRWVLKL